MEKYAHFVGAKNVRKKKYWTLEETKENFTFLIYKLLFAP